MKQFIQENQSLIRAVIKKMTGSYNEDIEQDVYIKTWRNMDKYQESGKLRQWICTLTANLCRDYFKSRQYRLEAGQLNDEQTLEEIPSAQRNQEEILDARQRQKIILKAVDSLPRKLRQVVIWYEFEDQSYDRIAARTGLPVGTVKSRLFNARKILAEKLKFLQGE